MPRLRVEHNTGVDLLKTSGAMDFDGGSLIVWTDERRNHMLAAYSPSSEWVAMWEEVDDGGPVPAESSGPS